jgi:DNA end-binding protein Ku
MPRAMWSGSISFGLVNIPVKVHAAIHEHTVHFHQVDKRSGSRIRYDKVAEKTGKEVPNQDIELGYEVSKGRLVIVDPDEVEELRPRTTRTIDITDFVDLAEVDPVYYNRTYWLAPDGEAARHPYGLLQAAMEDRGRVGVGMVVMRNKQYLAAIRPRDGALAMSTMRFADEVVAKSSIDAIPSRLSKPDTKEMRLAKQIIDGLAGPWKPEQYRDTYTEEVRKLVQAHDKGRELVIEEAPAAQANVVDLMSALEATVAAARGRGDRRKALERAADRLSEEAAAESDGRSSRARKTTRSPKSATSAGTKRSRSPRRKSA